MKPLNSSGPILATAENRDTVAIEPLSKYWNGSRSAGSAPASSALIAVATYLAPWIAPCATPGTPSTAAMSPMTNTFGCPGIDRSGSTLTRPARSSSTVDCSARSRPSPLAWTPGGPHLASRLDAPDGAVGVLDRDAVAVHVGDHRAQLNLHAHLLQPGGRPLTQLFAERRQHRGRGVEQYHPRPGRVDVPERALQRVSRPIRRSARPFRRRWGRPRRP